MIKEGGSATTAATTPFSKSTKLLNPLSHLRYLFQTVYPLHTLLCPQHECPVHPHVPQALSLIQLTSTENITVSGMTLPSG